MLSLIICSKYSQVSTQLENNIAETIGNTPYEIVHIDNSRGQYSIFQAYNKGVERAKYPYLCFMHEDIVYHSQGWGEKVITHLQDERIGFIGLAGSYFENQVSISWHRWSDTFSGCCLNYIQSSDGKTSRVLIYPVNDGLVAVLDGFWICCRSELFTKDNLGWDEEYYIGFHQYDSDICMQAVKAGYWNKVVYNVLIEHQSMGDFNEEFYKEVVRFHQKWDHFLPIVAPGYKMPEGYNETHRAILEIGRLNMLVNKYKKITTSEYINEKKREIIWKYKKPILSTFYQNIERLKRRFNTHKLKVALCCIAKMENDYIREFVEHYNNLGFDNITIFDNNNIDGETFNEIIPDYIESGLCRIVDYRGKKICQLDAYQEFYDRFGRQYDWIAYFDCDEFLTLNKHKTIQGFLTQKKFNNYQQIHVNWLMYGDNEMLDNDGRPMQERFSTPITPFQKFPCEPYYANNHTKTITRGSLKKVKMNHVHTCYTPYYRCCSVDGQQCDTSSSWIPNNHSEAYLKHFSTKTIGEWIRIKQKRGFPDMPAEMFEQFLNLSCFYRQNKRTSEKEEYARKLMEEIIE